MRKLIAAAAVVAGLGVATMGTAEARPDKNCPTEEWVFSEWDSDAAGFMDKNGDGYVCYKFVEGTGNTNVANLGGFNFDPIVVKDNLFYYED